MRVTRWSAVTTPAANLVLAVAIVGAAAATVSAAKGTVRVIVVTGDPAPDGNGTLLYIGQPSSPLSPQIVPLNESGQVAFRADVSGTGGIFFGDGTNLAQIARSGQVAPGGNGVFGDLASPVINNAGEVAYHASPDYS